MHIQKWLTLKNPNLCICTSIYTHTPHVSHACVAHMLCICCAGHGCDACENISNHRLAKYLFLLAYSMLDNCYHISCKQLLAVKGCISKEMSRNEEPMLNLRLLYNLYPPTLGQLIYSILYLPHLWVKVNIK